MQKWREKQLEVFEMKRKLEESRREVERERIQQENDRFQKHRQQTKEKVSWFLLSSYPNVLKN